MRGLRQQGRILPRLGGGVSWGAESPGLGLLEERLGIPRGDSAFPHPPEIFGAGPSMSRQTRLAQHCVSQQKGEIGVRLGRHRQLSGSGQDRARDLCMLGPPLLWRSSA